MMRAIVRARLCTLLKQRRAKKSTLCLIQKASRCAADRTPKTKTILLENYVYFLFHWFSGEICMFLLSLHKGRHTSKELKRNMNDGTIVFLMSLLIIFFIKKETLAQVFS